MKINIDSAILEYDDNVLYVRVRDDLVLDKNDMELLLQTAVEITGKKKYYAIIDTASGAETTLEARNYYATSDYSKYRYADAFVVNSLPTKLLVNFYLKFNKPPVKSKMFNSMEDARAWVNELKTNNADNGLVSKVL